MTIKVGINGFGRIGRNVLRSAIQNFSDIEIVAINDLLEPDYLAYMLQYDSVHGRFKGTVSVEGNTLIVNGKKIRLTQERDPANLKWNEVGADVVIEAVGLPATFTQAIDLVRPLFLDQWPANPGGSWFARSSPQSRQPAGTAAFRQRWMGWWSAA